MKLWVDDERLPPNAGWVHARDAETAWALLAAYNEITQITHISLDHDLGEGMSGYDLVKKMAEYHIFPANIYVHTMNPVGAVNMLELVKRYAPRYVDIQRTLPWEVAQLDSHEIIET